MKIVKKILKGFLIVIVSIGLLCVVADLAWSYVPQFKSAHKLDYIADYERNINDIEISDSARIIGLGEASHGNSDFQELKLSVLKQLVERENVRSFSIEGDFGEGLIINDYIHGDSDITTAKEAVSNLSFSIYQTQQMIDLVEWMHDYNANCAEGDEVSFYGFDMQNPEAGLKRIVDYCREKNIDVSYEVLESFISRSENEYKYNSEDFANSICELKDIFEEQLLNGSGVNGDNEAAEDYREVQKLLRIVYNCQDFIELAGAYDTNDYNAAQNLRDKYMAENVEWIYNYEANLGNDKIMISGHNGHVAYKGTCYTSMGSNLKDMFGDKYYVIGTDFYNTVCNINAVGADNTRDDHKFNSADILAYNAKYYDGSYYVELKNLSENADAKELMENGVNMGSLGEGYGILMTFMPTSYRIVDNPASLYDAMIFIYDANPIVVIS